MSRNSKLLVRRIGDLVETSERLREVLRRYERANVDLARRVERGQPTIEAMENIDAPDRRKEVTETFDEFEAARHQVRLALMVVSLEEGSNRSDVGRMLGVSRQLASRLAIEAEEAGS